MGLGLAAVQNTLELHNLGYLKNSKNIFEIGSQELQLKKEEIITNIEEIHFLLMQLFMITLRK